VHAVIKIICFLIFGAAMAVGTPPLLWTGAGLVAALYLIELLRGVPAHLPHALNMLRRLRWLFLSILIVYLFFTPGVLLIPDVLWGPTREGLLQGLARIAVLVLIVAAVNVLIGSTGQGEFLSAVSWCLRPLSWCGLSHERLALRISLTLEAVGVLRQRYQHEARGDAPTGQAEAFEPRLMAIAGTAHRLFARVIEDAEQARTRRIALPEETHPPLWQWLIPLLLGGLLLMVNLLAGGAA